MGKKVLTLRRSIQLALRIKVSCERVGERERGREVAESADAAFNLDAKFSRCIDSA